jgi:hypothetical protein
MGKTATVVKRAQGGEPIPYDNSNTLPSARMRFTVIGIRPLMTHNPVGMMDKGPGGVKGSRIPEAEAEAEAGVYRMEDGTCALKGESFRWAILGAAGAWKGAKRSTMKSVLAHIVVVEDLVPLLCPDGTPIKDYVIDRRRAIIQGQGIIRCRPRFDEWMARFTVEFDQQLVKLADSKIIADILADGGQRKGVGDYRPECDGTFGRFQVRDYLIID